MHRLIQTLCLLSLILGVFAPGAMRGETNLVLHLPLLENADDVSPYSHPTTIHNKLEFKEGAAFFSGQAVGVGITNLIFANKPFTVSMSIRLTGKKMMYGLFEQFDSRGRNRWLHLMLRGTLQPYLGFYINDAISPHPIRANQWTHLTFAYDGKYQMIWVNGEPMCARRAKPFRGRKGTLWIGKSPRWKNVPSYDFEGYMKDIRIYDGLLTISRIRELAGHRIRRTASLDKDDTLPDPTTMTKSLNRARDGGVPFLFIDGGHLTLTGETSQVYELEGSSNIVGPWEALGRMTNTTGIVEADDPSGGRGKQRFYRIRFIGAK